jgi:hypothetical protein
MGACERELRILLVSARSFRESIEAWLVVAGRSELAAGRQPWISFTYQVASSNPYQPPCRHAFPNLPLQPCERRPPPLVGVHVLCVVRRAKRGASYLVKVQL